MRDRINDSHRIVMKKIFQLLSQSFKASGLDLVDMAALLLENIRNMTVICSIRPFSADPDFMRGFIRCKIILECRMDQTLGLRSDSFRQPVPGTLDGQG